ncbi:hypothetical protein [Novosphingobium cyanobacteriorum]|uniref:Cytochrome C n=1 Tax=Novosphingobium cyanobacteriorum TaxID=3024215 RepID=A0ABT6CNK5_9SPHN|nr:hypothetical protein [Novosphingobium cyanobacteriorum]MDF8334680.1 hypothetical protein [Novosphingobium cyanobacteriorum]
MKPTAILVPAAAVASLLVASSALNAQATPAEPLPLPELMGHVMQRNATQLWAWTAQETDAGGNHSGEPRTDEEWEDAESDALTLRQLAVVLRGAPYRQEDPRWDRLAGDLEAAARQSAEAAERKDLVGLTSAGEAINARCVACHWAFAPALEATPPPVPIS